MPRKRALPPTSCSLESSHGCKETSKEDRIRKEAEGPPRQQDRQGRAPRKFEEVVGPLTPWHYPVPVRRSRFRAAEPAWAPFNVEVALDRIEPFALGHHAIDDVLACDYHVQLEGNWPGRLGSGRSGVYRGKYLKGVGRTLAAANWNEGNDRYHGSGHMSVGSALRERLITQALAAKGLGSTIVPCESVLLRSLSTAETDAVQAGASSSLVTFTPADATMAALTVKPADFARMGNIVFALSYFDTAPQWIGRLFLAFEAFLRAPGEQGRAEGTPSEIAAAMDKAFRCGFANFQAFGRIGLLWVSVVGNVSLDGRVLDLETPHYFGAPFVGMRTQRGAPRAAGSFIGFEELAVAGSWRRFVGWLLARLDWMAAPSIVPQPEARLFLRDLATAIRRRFSRRHLLYDDRALVTRAAANVQSVWNLSRGDQARLRALAAHACHIGVHGSPDTPPPATWRRLTPAPAPPTPTPFRFDAPAFLPCTVTAEACRFADDIARLGAESDLRRLLHGLSPRHT